MARPGLLYALIIVSPALAVAPAAADGALAIGQASNFEVAIGAIVNAPGAEEARASSLKRCRSYAPAPAAQSSCASVTIFRNRCYALALDPKTGVPGFGWAVERSKEGAEQQALENCKDTAGEDRRSFCRVIESDCDEN